MLDPQPLLDPEVPQTNQDHQKSHHNLRSAANPEVLNQSPISSSREPVPRPAATEKEKVERVREIARAFQALKVQMEQLYEPNGSDSGRESPELCGAGQCLKQGCTRLWGSL